MVQATDSLLRPRPSGVAPFVIGSTAAHVGVAAVLVALSSIFGQPPVDPDQKPIKATLVRLGKPRDEKLLPRKEEEPPPAPKPEAEPVKVPTPEPAVVKIPTKDAKPDKPSKDASKDGKKSLFDALKRASKGASAEVEGALDGDPDGDSATQEGERYFGLLRAVVRRNYEVSDTIPESERRALKAEVTLWIGATGEVLNVRLTKASGNELFDSAVLGAVKRASPFAPPPDGLKDSLKKQGVAIVFRAME
jgi:TonB family protein